jgi:NADPH-dependent 2,4-dienoyl-CoA reductase/sulfur reductase-like enzyme
MTGLTRRDAALGLGATAANVALGGTFAIAQAAPKVVIIGGGPGGATVANQIRQGAPVIDVTLIEPQRTYATCFFSNLYLGGFRTFASLTHTYDGLRAMGVKVIHERASDVDTNARTVTIGGNRKLPYDALVVAPGIDLKYNSIEGYSPEAARIMPHAYQAGAQTRLLKAQLEAMKPGGVVVISPPDNPYRCPPGPYERACLIANYLKTKKPGSKLIILDPKRSFSKQAVFTEAFQKYYRGIVELRLSDEIDSVQVVKVDPKARTLTTKSGNTIKADVANVIPNQRAGEIANRAGLTQGDWCPINAENFSSTKAKSVYVLGDASIAAPMPKSAFAANNQAKVVAADIMNTLVRKEKFPPSYRNTCWSMLAPEDSAKIGAAYQPKDNKLEEIAPFISKTGEDAATRKATYEESLAWYAAITQDIFQAKRDRRKT